MGALFGKAPSAADMLFEANSILNVSSSKLQRRLARLEADEKRMQQQARMFVRQGNHEVCFGDGGEGGGGEIHDNTIE